MYLSYIKNATGYNHDRMIKALKREFANNSGNSLPNPSKGKYWAEYLNAIYNKGLPSKRHVYFG